MVLIRSAMMTAVHPRHDDIAEDKLDALSFRLTNPDRGLAVVGIEHGVSILLENPACQAAQGCLVLDYKDRF